MRRLITDAQAKFRKMVEDQRLAVAGSGGTPPSTSVAPPPRLPSSSAFAPEEGGEPVDSPSGGLKASDAVQPSGATKGTGVNSSETATEKGEPPPPPTPPSAPPIAPGQPPPPPPRERKVPPLPSSAVAATVANDSCAADNAAADTLTTNTTTTTTTTVGQQLVRPPSPAPGPSNKQQTEAAASSPPVVSAEPVTTSSTSASSCSNVSTRLRLENERLKREVAELKRVLSASGAVAQGGTQGGTASETANGLDGLSDAEKVQALESELAQAREALATAKSDRKRLKAEKFDLLNQMKQLYATLEDKEKELRDFIRSFEQERCERERERWSLLRHARDEAERSLNLAAQLDIKDQQLIEARRQLSSACLSDGGGGGGGGDNISLCRASINGRGGGGGEGGVPPPPHTPTSSNLMLGGGGGDRGSCSADSGVRGSSDRESGATSATGGNLSDSTTDVTTPKECNSPSLSPLNAHPFSRSLDHSTLSRSVEQLSSPPPMMLDQMLDPPPVRRSKERLSSRSSCGLRSGGGAGGGGPWGSISRVFARSRHRSKVPSPSSHDDSLSACGDSTYGSVGGTGAGGGRSWSPLTEEGYAEKLRLLREAGQVPMERWRAPTVLAWLEIALGMPQYGPRCAENVKSGKVLLELSDVELECGLGISHPMHRKKLRLAIEEHRQPALVRYPPIAQLGHTWVSSEWLPDLGLAQYSENFAANMVDARMLDNLSKKELEKFLGVTRKFHQASIVHGIHLLRMMKYDRQALAVRRHQCETIDADPLVWTNQRFIRWARNIDLGEYADNLKDSGVHGALVVLEPSLNGDTMATALGIPPSRHMIRRHLTTELEALVLPARASFERLARERRRADRLASGGGSLGRSFSRSYGALSSAAASAHSPRASLVFGGGESPPPTPPPHQQADREVEGVEEHRFQQQQQHHSNEKEKEKRRASLRSSLGRVLGLKPSSSSSSTHHHHHHQHHSSSSLRVSDPCPLPSTASSSSFVYPSSSSSSSSPFHPPPSLFFPSPSSVPPPLPPPNNSFQPSPSPSYSFGVGGVTVATLSPSSSTATSSSDGAALPLGGGRRPESPQSVNVVVNSQQSRHRRPHHRHRRVKSIGDITVTPV